MYCPSPISIFTKPSVEYPHGREILVPCGKCYECRKQKAKEWFFRLKEEWKRSESSFFVTLTYSVNNIPFDGELFHFCDSDRESFIRSLRDAFSYISKKNHIEPKINFKYFCIEEYMPVNLQPHYHMLLFFNQPVNDMIPYLNKFWPFGRSNVERVNERRLAYCAGYTLKKLKDKIDYHGLDPPKSYMSKNLGLSFLESNSKVDYLKKHNLRWKEDGRNVRLPRYYKKKLIDDKEQIHRNCQAVESTKKYKDSVFDIITKFNRSYQSDLVDRDAAHENFTKNLRKN